MTPGQADPAVVRRHLAALRSALGNLRCHAGISPRELDTDHDRRWAVERGLQLCAQNALDIATHISSAEGLDAPDYGGYRRCRGDAAG